NLLTWLQQKYPLNEDDVILQKTTYIFDVSLSEIFWWSMVGASVVMLKPDAERDPMLIADIIAEKQVTMVSFVPTMLSMFMTSIKERDEYVQKIKSLKYILVAGEALNKELANECYTAINDRGTKLINLYGPTEASIYVSYHECKGNEGLVPIGKPISNIQMHIINE
ncbi:AMP-binding protein, partial [Bacillus thuringiensis]|uniref:AMP-binding protein n=2 Tax=Bacillus thuringiensis TaxID=1428 RepID=UPI002FBF057E